jgi:hypothetical protein
VLRCPKCQTRIVRLAPQRGIGERLLGLLTIYPTRCQLCTHRFLAFRGRPFSIPQRDYQRVRVHFPVWFRSAFYQGEFPGQEGKIVELSLGGCRLESAAQLPKGARLRLQFEVAEDQAPVTVEEAVVRSHPSKGMGLVFTKVRRNEKRRLGRIIRGRLSSMWPVMARDPYSPTSGA